MCHTMGRGVAQGTAQGYSKGCGTPMGCGRTPVSNINVPTLRAQPSMKSIQRAHSCPPPGCCPCHLRWRHPSQWGGQSPRRGACAAVKPRRRSLTSRFACAPASLRPCEEMGSLFVFRDAEFGSREFGSRDFIRGLNRPGTLIHSAGP